MEATKIQRFPSKSTTEILNTFNRHKTSALLKASVLNNHVGGVTIGPNSTVPLDGVDDKTDYKTQISPRDSYSNGIHSSPSTYKSNVNPKNVADYSVRKLLFEMDQKRQRNVKEMLNSHLVKLKEMFDSQQLELDNHHERIQKEAEERAILEDQKLWHQAQEDELVATKRREQLIREQEKHALRVQERNLMIKEAEKEETRKCQETASHLEKIHNFQLEFRTLYQNILDAIKTCKDKQSLRQILTSASPKLRSINELLESMFKQCKIGEFKETSLETAEAKMKEVRELTEEIKAEIERINDLYEKNAQEAAEAKRQQEAEERAQQVQQQAHEGFSNSASTTIISNMPTNIPDTRSNEALDFVDPEALKTYLELKENLEKFQASYSDLLIDDMNLKKFRFDCQKAVNIPVNAISPVNGAHLQDKYIKLSNLLSGKSVDIGGNKLITASLHPSGIAFCKDLLAKKFVLQGDTAVSSKPEAAFAIAAVIVALWAEFPDFGKLLLAHFYRECPYLVPIFMPQVEGQSNEDYYKSLGYRYNENGEVEKQDKFLKRMSGIMRLYAAIIVTFPRQLRDKPHPHYVNHAWQWISRLVNLDPRPDICASLLYDFLEITGSTMFSCYRQQFYKLLHLIVKEYFPKIEQVTPRGSGGPVVRLEQFLQKILKQGLIPPPVGLLHPNFW